MRPYHTNLVVETLRRSVSAPLRRRGVALSGDDVQTVLDVYQQWILLALDLGYLHPDTLARDARRLLTDMVKVDVLDLNQAFAECLQQVRLQNNKGFKALCSIISPHLYPLIKDDLRLMMFGDVFAAKRLMQIFAFTSRLTLKDIDLTQQMVEEYRSVEDNIKTDLPIPLVNRLNNIVKSWLRPFDPSRCKPGHGSGAVAFLRRASLEDKYRDLSTDQMLRYAYGGNDDWVVDFPPKLLLRRSQTIFVPKSYKTFRTISMEPATLMYFQQGIWREIDRVVLRDPYLRSHIDFHDQERNKALARRGSIERGYATIDLSAASDSVSLELVKGVFRGTSLLRYLLATRSRETLLPDGAVIPLKKFAPMGSAVCFPVETLIFASVCELVTRELRVPGHYSVFGDDIIVPTNCVDRTMQVLGILGFRVNHDKSFYRSDCWFRESCGGEYCDGFDVTPLRVTRRYSHRERDVRLEGLIDSANNAYQRGFRNLREFYLLKIRETGLVPLFAPTAILADNYTNYHTRHRWRKSLQRIEVRISDTSDRYTVDDLSSQDESIRYRHWLELASHRKTMKDMSPNRYAREAVFRRTLPPNAIASIVCKPTKSVRNTWRCKPYEISDQNLINRHTGRGDIPRPLNSDG